MPIATRIASSCHSAAPTSVPATNASTMWPTRRGIQTVSTAMSTSIDPAAA